MSLQEEEDLNYVKFLTEVMVDQKVLDDYSESSFGRMTAQDLEYLGLGLGTGNNYALESAILWKLASHHEII